MLSKSDMEQLTPMMQQYMEIKASHPEAILFFRLGDFYELFFEDAMIASKELEIALTARDCGLKDRAPMCGVPHHVLDFYANKLVKKGYVVAICDQLEDPKFAKGIVKRNVTRIITPGTIIDTDILGADNNYLVCLAMKEKSLGVTYVDITTGELFGTTFTDNFLMRIDNFLSMIDPSEILIDKALFVHYNFESVFKKFHLYVNQQDFSQSLDRMTISKIKDYMRDSRINYEKLDPALQISVGRLLHYIHRFHDSKLDHIKTFELVTFNDYLEIDSNSRKNLELTRNVNDGTRRDSLLSLLDHTSTSMGSRRLTVWLEQPLLSIVEIHKRQNMIEDLLFDTKLKEELKYIFKSIFDIDRFLSKVSYRRANPRDLIAFRNSIELFNSFKALLIENTNSDLKMYGERFHDLEALYELLSCTIVEEPPIAIDEGGIIKEGYSDELDDLRSGSISGKNRLLEYENQLKKETGIKNLRIVFNKRTGYFIEVTKSNVDKVLPEFIRKQTLTNAERYTSDTLESIQNIIFGGEEEVRALELEIFNDIIDSILEKTFEIQEDSVIISEIDSLLSLAIVAEQNSYRKPELNTKGILSIVGGRHPIIEENLGRNRFIDNDTNIGQQDNLIQIITGPNMAGKSTYMRQIALITILAQMGSFVPAKEANICIVDRIFTRIGASDNIAQGDSTFMVEMKEVSNILAYATSKSLIILDEVGRGTSTSDGLSIAWSIAEYISLKIKAKTLFATHYHELTELSEILDNIVNLKVDVKEEGEDIIFLRKIVPGKADKSYGIEVARLAGLPPEIITRSKEILNMREHSEQENVCVVGKKESYPSDDMLSMKKYYDFIREIQQISVDHCTPLDSLNLLHNLVSKAKELQDE